MPLLSGWLTAAGLRTSTIITQITRQQTMTYTHKRRRSRRRRCFCLLSFELSGDESSATERGKNRRGNTITHTQTDRHPTLSSSSSSIMRNSVSLWLRLFDVYLAPTARASSSCHQSALDGRAAQRPYLIVRESALCSSSVC